ncbi:MAG: WGR domain-containing protein [Cypionkella sp.]|nr:WGR domain-containing protein [Cypionkella sp.]
MLTFLLTRRTPPGERFYRVEVADNLFGEYSVVREWGQRGKRGQQMLVWFSNLREACIAAENWRRRAVGRGYDMEGRYDDPSLGAR